MVDASNQTNGQSASDNENTALLPHAPKRMFFLDLCVHADSLSDLVAVLRDITWEINQGGPRECLAMGASSNGGYWKLTIDPEMTHEKYFEASEVYLKAVEEFEKQKSD